MGSSGDLTAAHGHSTYASHDEADLSKAAQLLIDRHGKDADIVAARRADALFRDGQSAEGAWWLQIFRVLADRLKEQIGILG